MGSLNQCNFIGRVGKTPELRYTAAGVAVATISLAVDDKFKDKDGNKKTEWVNVVFWKQLAEVVGKHVDKGQEIFVSGRFQTRSWEDKDGKKCYSSEIVANELQFIGGGGRKEDAPGAGGWEKPSGQEYDPDSDVPF